MMRKEELMMLLKQEVVPALGCTEPVCVALAAADAAYTVGGDVMNVKVEMNPGIYKNGMTVGIPGFDKTGLSYATALGAYLANPQKGLKLFEDITSEIGRRALNLTGSNLLELTVAQEEAFIYVRAEVKTSCGTGVTIIRGGHSNVVYREKNGEILFDKADERIAGTGLHEELKEMKVDDLICLVETCTYEELQFMEDGARMNGEVADYGLKHKVGIGMASALGKYSRTDVIGTSLLSRVMTRVASSAESRMSGCPFAVMSSAGSGNHGITAILPVVETALFLDVTPERLVKALALSHTLNIYIKEYTGKLSATCGCGVSAASAASAAMVWLMGGSHRQVGEALINMSGTLTGMICDGGKVGCALKLATAVSAAVLCACMVMEHAVIPPTDGICALTPEEAVRNMGRISNPGMIQTDQVILEIMMEKDQRNHALV